MYVSMSPLLFVAFYDVVTEDKKQFCDFRRFAAFI